MDKRVDIVTLKMVKDHSIIVEPRQITCAADASKLIKNQIGSMDREAFILICLNAKSEPTNIGVIHIGTLTMAMIHPREIYKIAILSNAGSIIIGHNHPSGNVEPSLQDYEVTKRIVYAGGMVGIEVLDHIIVSEDDKMFSLRKSNPAIFITDKSVMNLICENSNMDVGKVRKTSKYRPSLEIEKGKMESILKKILKLNTYYYIAVSDEEIILSNEHAYYKTPFVPGAALCPWKDLFAEIKGTTSFQVDSDIFALEGEMVVLLPLTEEIAKELYSRTIAHTIHWFGEQSKTIGSSVMIQCEYDTRKNKVTILAGFENDVMLLLLQISQID